MWNICAYIYPPPPSKKGGYVALLLSVGRSVSQFTNSFRSHSSQRLYILKWNLESRFIIRTSKLSSVLGTIKQFVTELCPSYLGTFQLFTVSVNFLRRGCTWNIYPREGGISVPQTYMYLVSTWFGLPNGGKNIAYIIVTYFTFLCLIGKPRYNLLPPPHPPLPTLRKMSWQKNCTFD